MFDITWMDEVTVQILHKRGQRLLGSVLETRVEAGPGLGEAGALKYSELEAAHARLEAADLTLITSAAGVMRLL